MAYELSQVFVVFGEACLVSSFYMKEKYKQLIFLLIASVFLGAQYFLLGALTGGFLEALCLIRVVCFFFHEKKFFKEFNLYLAITFSIIAILIASLTFTSWIVIMPVAGFIIFTILHSLQNEYLVRIAYGLHAICYGVYTFLVTSYTAFAFCIITLICSIVLIILLAKRNKSEHIENNNIPVETADTQN